MAGRCFNCLKEDHVAALCRNPSRCRGCLKEGHMARNSRVSRSPPPAPSTRLVAATVRRPSPPRAVAALPPAVVAPALAHAVGKGVNLAPNPAVPCVMRALSPSAPVVPVVEPTVEVARPVGAPERRPRLERYIIPRSAAVDEAKASCRLVVHVVGGRGTVAASTVSALIVRACPLASGCFTFHWFLPANFLCVCSNSSACGALLGAGVIQGSGFSLSFNRWNRQLGASLRPFRYMVHVEMARVPAHVWVTGTADYILGQPCWVERIGTETASRADMGRFSVIAWTDNPERIARELLVGIPEPTAPYDTSEDNLRVPREAMVPVVVSMLDYAVVVHLLRVADMEAFMDVSSDGGSTSGDSMKGICRPLGTTISITVWPDTRMI
ncbi:hypothetical protein BRADI_2g35267v3 [Brachypodium distachyon]|uniref:CCHC-type domain-containing protein n=1 Tax=Brachypodium distachyon TaxID=15368 RepID=A0A2K2DBX4_BRADI|nr:hypothetical protein BRADI_2g35267v3 [Brachypodium distachyon]